MLSNYDRVRKIVSEQLGVDESKIKPESNFVNDLGADSLDTVELVIEIQEEFDIVIPDDVGDNVSTLQQAVNAVEEQIGSSTPSTYPLSTAAKQTKTTKKATKKATKKKTKVSRKKKVSSWVDAKAILAETFGCAKSRLKLDTTFASLRADEGKLACAILDLQAKLNKKKSAANFREWITVRDIKEWTGLK